MRLVAFERGGRPVLGASIGDWMVPFDRLPDGVPADAPTLLARGTDRLAELASAPLTQVRSTQSRSPASRFCRPHRGKAGRTASA